jgi:hypothetical protein
MRIARLLVILTATAAPLLGGCERESASDSAAPPSATTRPPTTARTFTPSTQFLAVTQPSTQPRAATTTAASADPLATPSTAVVHLFDLMRKQDVNGVRAMMADPLPAEKLRGEVAAVAKRFQSGATWAIVEAHDDGLVGVVLFRTTYPDGRDDVSPLFFINRYDRWKVLLGQLNQKKLTPGEIRSLNKQVALAAERLNVIRGVQTTKPATATAPAGN